MPLGLGTHCRHTRRKNLLKSGKIYPVNHAPERGSGNLRPLFLNP